MPEITEEIEALKINNISLNGVLKEDFLEKLKKLNLNAISLVLISDKKDEKDMNMLFPIILGHHNNEEVTKKVVHIQSSNTKILNDFLKLIKGK